MLVLFRNLKGTDFLIASLAYLIVLLLSFTLHEWAHAYAAYSNGDYTPKAAGRLTINPLAHIDPIGFLCSALFCFGWAKPVPVNPTRFRKYRKGMVLTSIAGVTMNLLLAFVACGAYMLFTKNVVINNYFLLFVQMLFYTMFSLNISLFVFNLLPIAPLDGFNFIAAITSYGNKFVQFMARYGFIILLALLIIGDFAGGSLLARLVYWISYPIVHFWGLII